MLAGDMAYYNGTSWVSVSGGGNGQTLVYCNGVPTWGGCLPILTSNAMSGISFTTASGGGNVSNDGGTPITARGVCWSTSPNPTVANSKTTDGTGMGTYSSNLTNLISNTLYYARAYASNSVGTAYGNEINFTTASTTLPAIGSSYLGGKLAYILQPGDPGYDVNVSHGLIAAPSDQSTGIQWYNGCNLTTGTTSTTIGTGNANTNAIVAVQGAGSYAAKLCYDLVLNGYSDWYLPSKDELNKLYLYKNSIGGFTPPNYWSSTEYSAIDAWSQYFGDGSQANENKGTTRSVRAVRVF